MNTSTKLLTIMFASTLVAACGGGGGGGSSTPAPTPVADEVDDTQDIVAQRDFSFDIGETITLSMNYQGSADGALHLYTKAAFTTENGDVIADPMSRITTVYPTRTSQVELEVNGNWTKLYAQWVPMSASESEKNWVISLNQSNNNYHLDF
ncbi:MULTISPECIES: hypothetical protein [Vibrio]|jgi:hypothetical protein|uniref:hypothetical protein n=1 Tax=Vibrio TaxID=662 RepID=UPI00069DE6DE|nr:MULTISPECIES: hypothetical protein [Vibrio]CAH1575908.1 conserved exported hypothetical protein [Vibrio rotiferianus]EKO3799851.1 hypothetical protein [Vibrio harveyi]EKO3819648.1 hypothetical protein [Vibrio harveyi]EKO3830529.1 hypothetical protein [Vibrio harveyi]EKO3851409.1 hypothetical protein [Vibrio harveyi]